jgi:hypothetical protein
VSGPAGAQTVGRFRQVMADMSQGRHREAYAMFCVGVVLAFLGLWGVVATQVILSAILAALTFLVFETTIHSSPGRTSLDQVLEDRDGFATFGKILLGVRDLRIYGPTAVNVLTNVADIRRYVLRPGGQVRVLTLCDDPQTLAAAGFQLDDNLDLKQTLRNSLVTAAKLGAEPGFSYRQLPVNPGFSLVIVNADEPGGYVIFESHGFRDDSIGDRMHIKISKADSPRWFVYWVTRFEAMWDAAQPSATSAPSNVTRMTGA